MYYRQFMRVQIWPMKHDGMVMADDLTLVALLVKTVVFHEYLRERMGPDTLPALLGSKEGHLALLSAAAMSL